jgi:hypothetical protein
MQNMVLPEAYCVSRGFGAQLGVPLLVARIHQHAACVTTALKSAKERRLPLQHCRFGSRTDVNRIRCRPRHVVGYKDNLLGGVGVGQHLERKMNVHVVGFKSSRIGSPKSAICATKTRQARCTSAVNVA